MLACLKKIYEKPSSIFKSRDITLQKKFSINKAMIFSNFHIWMWQLEHKEWWEMKHWRFWTVVLDKNLECPLDYKEIQQVHAKGNQSWIFIGMINAEAETPIIWPTDVKNLLIKRPYYWERLKAGGEEDDRGWDGWMASLTRWHEFEQDPGVGEGQRSLACSSPWGCKESDMTEWLNWTEHTP